MQGKRRTEEQIIAILKEHEAGINPADLCRNTGSARLLSTIGRPSTGDWKSPKPSDYGVGERECRAEALLPRRIGLHQLGLSGALRKIMYLIHCSAWRADARCKRQFTLRAALSAVLKTSTARLVGVATLRRCVVDRPGICLMLNTDYVGMPLTDSSTALQLSSYPRLLVLDNIDIFAKTSRRPLRSLPPSPTRISQSPGQRL